MSGRLVIGLDSSTQSTKAIAWTKTGKAVAEGRAALSLDTPQAGYAEQDVEDWWQAACTALKQLGNRIDLSCVDGLAISNQRETVAFLDDDGKALRPAILWLDERARDEIGPLNAEFGRARLHEITGKPADITPVVYRLCWLKRHHPEILEKAAHIIDVHGFLTGQLTGRQVASWTSADPFGVFDIARKTWSQPVLEHLGLVAAQFGELEAPSRRIGSVTEEAAVATGLPVGLAVYAGGGDGQCAGLGVNGARPGVVYLNLGTALITGAWAPDPMIGKHWRTMTSPTGEGYFLEGCQRAGAYLINWFIDAFAGGRDDPDVFARLEKEAADLPLGSEGVIVCPHLTGCMDPHWDPSARASFNGLGPGHGLGHLYRALLEAMTLESARAIEAMRGEGLALEKIVAVGGGGNSPLWTRMFSDATGLPLTVSRSLEASALGAGMSAAVGAGWFRGFDAAATAMSGEGGRVQPDVSAKSAWDALSARQAQAYRPMI